MNSGCATGIAGTYGIKKKKDKKKEKKEKIPGKNKSRKKLLKK